MTAARAGGPAKKAAVAAPRARPKTAKAIRDIQLEDDDELTPAEAMQAEVDLEDTDDESVTVRLETRNGDADITIPHAVDWPARALDLLADGRVHSWAHLVFSDTDWQTWQDLEPTVREANAFIAAWEQAGGATAGKSRAQRRSSRRSRMK